MQILFSSHAQSIGQSTVVTEYQMQYHCLSDNEFLF